MTQHAITIRPICFSGKTFAKLPADLQAAILKAGKEAGAYGRQIESGEDTAKLLIGLAQMATVHAYAKRRGYPTYTRATLREVFASALVSLPALFTPFIIIGGKIFGWFTATESACIAVRASAAPWRT